MWLSSVDHLFNTVHWLAYYSCALSCLFSSSSKKIIYTHLISFHTYQWYHHIYIFVFSIFYFEMFHNIICFFSFPFFIVQGLTGIWMEVGFIKRNRKKWRIIMMTPQATADWYQCTWLMYRYAYVCVYTCFLIGITLTHVKSHKQMNCDK